jgi:transmembrane sensor
MVTRDNSMDMKIAEEAAEWLIELDNPDPQALARFAAWLKASPRHVEEFLLVSAVWTEFDDFDPDRRFPVRRMLDAATRNVQPISPGAQVPEPQAAKPDRRRWFAAAAVVLIAVLAGVWGVFALQAGTYVTAIGEQRSFKLEDGSIIHLNTQSRVEVRYSEAERTVRLLAGEAMFGVARDAERPFRVMSGDAIIQALGTEFNVYRRAEGTTVSVVEGVVQVLPTGEAPPGPVPNAPSPASTLTHGTISFMAPARVEAGEQAQVSAGGEVVTQPVSDISGAVAWRERRLVFRGDRLEVVAREFNRYNRVQIRIEGEEVRARRLTAVFDADDPRSLVLFLKSDAQLNVVADDRQVVIRPAG